MTNWRVFDNRGELDVLKFGARGDGSTDNTEAFADAIRAGAARSHGFVLVIPPGDYHFDDPGLGRAAIHLDGIQNVTIRGVNKRATILRFAGSFRSPMIAATNCSGIVIESLQIRGSSAAPLPINSAVDVRGGFDNHIRDVTVFNTGEVGLRISQKGTQSPDDNLPEGSSQPFRCSIKDCFVSDTYGESAISTLGAGAEQVIISGNHIRRAGASGIDVGAQDVSTGSTNPMAGAIVANNTIRGVESSRSSSSNAYGIRFASNTQRSTVIGNVIEDVTGSNASRGIMLLNTDSGLQSFDHTVVGNNVFNVSDSPTASIGIGVSNTSGSKFFGVNMTGNTVRNTQIGLGYRLLNNDNGPGANSGQGWNVTGNTVHSSLAGIATQAIGSRDPSRADFVAPLDAASISGNLVFNTTQGTSWTGIGGFFRSGNIIGNTVRGEGRANTVGIRWNREVLGSGTLYTLNQININGNSVLGCSVDVLMPPQSIPLFQMGHGYEWLEDNGPAGGPTQGRHRKSILFPNLITQGTITGTES